MVESPNASLKLEVRVRIVRVIITSDSPLNDSLKPEVRVRIVRGVVTSVCPLNDSKA